MVPSKGFHGQPPWIAPGDLPLEPWITKPPGDTWLAQFVLLWLGFCMSCWYSWMRWDTWFQSLVLWAMASHTALFFQPVISFWLQLVPGLLAVCLVVGGSLGGVVGAADPDAFGGDLGAPVANGGCLQWSFVDSACSSGHGCLAHHLWSGAATGTGWMGLVSTCCCCGCGWCGMKACCMGGACWIYIVCLVILEWLLEGCLDVVA